MDYLNAKLELCLNQFLSGLFWVGGGAVALVIFAHVFKTPVF